MVFTALLQTIEIYFANKVNKCLISEPIDRSVANRTTAEFTQSVANQYTYFLESYRRHSCSAFKFVSIYISAIAVT